MLLAIFSYIGFMFYNGPNWKKKHHYVSSSKSEKSNIVKPVKLNPKTTEKKSF